MEELFKSLSESVSEGCFEDILTLVKENLYDTFQREYEKEKNKEWDEARKIKDDKERAEFFEKSLPKRKYKYEMGKKILDLRDKAAKQAGEDAEKRGAKIPDSIKDFDTWSDRYKSKGEIGEKKTRLRHAKYQK